MKVGVLGTGQLALMMAQANKGLDVEFVPYGEKGCKNLDDFCTPVYASMDDLESLEAYIQDMDVVTYDTENLKIDEALRTKYIDKFSPSIEALKVFQHREYEKTFFVDQGLDLSLIHI